MAEAKIQITMISRRFQNIMSPLSLVRTNPRRQETIKSLNRQRRFVVAVYKSFFRVISFSNTWTLTNLRKIDVKLKRQRKRPNSALKKSKRKRSKRKQSKPIITPSSKIYRTAKICLFKKLRTISLPVKNRIFETSIIRSCVSFQAQNRLSKPFTWTPVI